jgi:hypothetical protein
MRLSGGEAVIGKGASTSNPILDLAVARARLAEAEWWEHLVARRLCDPDCIYCARLAAARAAVEKLERES